MGKAPLELLRLFRIQFRLDETTIPLLLLTHAMAEGLLVPTTRPYTVARRPNV